MDNPHSTQCLLSVYTHYKPPLYDVGIVPCAMPRQQFVGDVRRSYLHKSMNKLKVCHSERALQLKNILLCYLHRLRLSIKTLQFFYILDNVIHCVTEE